MRSAPVIRAARKEDDLPGILLAAAFLQLVLWSCAVCKAAVPGVMGGRRPLTVAQAVESTRVEGNFTGWQFNRYGYMPIVSDVSESPDGAYYVLRLVKGDLKRNEDLIEIVSGRLDSVDAAVAYRIVARMYTTALGGRGCSAGSRLTLGYFNPMTWVAGHTVAFLYTDGRRPIQAIGVDVATGAVRDLTHSGMDVVSFAVGPDGTIIFTAKLRHSMSVSESLLKNGFVVRNSDVFSLLAGDVDGYGVLDRCFDVAKFILRKGWRAPRRVMTNRQGYDRWLPGLQPRFSHDGSMVVIDGSPTAVPKAWEQYDNRVLVEEVRQAQTDLRTFYARAVQQLYLVTVKSASARPLWDAPAAVHAKVAWSSDDRELLIGPTYVPLRLKGPGGKDGEAAAVVDVASGDIEVLPTSAGLRKAGITEVSWVGPRTVVVRAGKLRETFWHARSGWRLGSYVPEAKELRRKGGVVVRVLQSMNSLPVVVASDSRTGERRTVLELDPKLRKEVEFGRATAFEWSDKEARRWYGRLYYPVQYTAGRRYPLVIQAHGIPPEGEFSLYGAGATAPGLGPGIAAFAAQELAGKGIAVLDIQDRVNGPMISPGEAKMYMGAYESAIDALVRKGLVDRSRIGITGYSRTVWHVEYALTHSSFPYAAAVADDGIDASYIQATLYGQNLTKEYALDNGAEPFGSGLVRWFSRAPGFLADRVRAPLLLIQSTGGLDMTLGTWEMFERLRELKRPVELAVIPEIQYGTHGTQNPAQCLAVQERVVAWFDFWLNRHEDGPLGDRDRYARWRALRRLYRAEGTGQAAVQ
jgi:hypothetical protein